MSWVDALVLGIVEGITEFLPVSSTGHLILAQRALGIEGGEAADAYAICIQAGAILAVLGLYRQRVAQMARGIVAQDVAGRALLINVVIAFFPAAIVGLLFNDPIDAWLFGLWPVVIAWAVGGVVILLLRGRSGTLAIHEITPKTAALIGLAQCLALWPGTSRSLATILGAVMLGVSIPAAVEFSFLLGVVTLGAATAYSGLKHGDVMLTTFGIGPLLVGFASAAISAAVAVKWLVGWLQSHGMEVFAVWRIGLAILVAGLLARGVLAS